jgi:hypothetical protein
MAISGRWLPVAVAAGFGLAGCPSDPRPREAPVTSIDAGARDVPAAGVGSTLGDSDGTEQLPPTTGRAAARAWLAAGPWRRWRCEATPHPGGGLSPHTLNRICNNDVLANAPAGPPWPVGSASVKELRDPASPERVIGYSVYLKVRDGDAGSDWFWFQSVSPDVALEPAPARDPDGTIAEGLGDRGGALAVCVGCHARSGDNDSGIVGPGDFVFTRVPAP